MSNPKYRTEEEVEFGRNVMNDGLIDEILREIKLSRETFKKLEKHIHKLEDKAKLFKKKWPD